MGMYVIDCPKCGKPHYWFSGNMDQRCPDCRVVKTENADGSITNTLTPREPGHGDGKL